MRFTPEKRAYVLGMVNKSLSKHNLNIHTYIHHTELIWNEWMNAWIIDVINENIYKKNCVHRIIWRTQLQPVAVFEVDLDQEVVK